MSVELADPTRFSLLTRVFGDAAMARIFAERETVEGWLRVERALARAQAEVGLITGADADAIAKACRFDVIDIKSLWDQTRNVGYPILPLVRQIARTLPPGPDGKVHLGATTQDIMDTATVLQLQAAVARLRQIATEFGGGLTRLMDQHVHSIMSARTHGQQAVPTTFGAKLAVYVCQLVDLDRRLCESASAMAVVSLHGAGGTSASWGASAGPLRRAFAERLQLGITSVPWHTARQRLVDVGMSFAMLASLAGRLAREVVSLSRTEIAELAEGGGRHKGASSTMPQKANPTFSEAAIGMAATAQSLMPALMRSIESEHERSAGEWQIEWEVLPTLACLAAGALHLMVDVVQDLQVNTTAMAGHLRDDSGLVMAEAYMLSAATSIGRERSHDHMYELAIEARNTEASIHDVVAHHADELWPEGGYQRLDPHDYVGDPRYICDVASHLWRKWVRGEDDGIENNAAPTY